MKRVLIELWKQHPDESEFNKEWGRGGAGLETPSNKLHLGVWLQRTGAEIVSKERFLR